MTKRLFAWVLVLAMVLSFMPVVSMGVSAEGNPGQHTGHEGWTEWTDKTKLPTDAGKYYLSVDVELTATWSVSKNIDLCLNGHTVTQTKSGARIASLTSGTLSVYDCAGTGMVTGGTAENGSAFNVGRNTTLNWYGGTITGNQSTSTGTVYLQRGTSAGSGAVFNLYGGEISGNKNKQGGAIYSAGSEAASYVGAQINIYGGTIKNNTATSSGGAIYVTGRGKVHIENATITGNKAGTAGSAIYAEGADHPIFLKNVEITGNTGTSTNAKGYSAAVYTAGAGTHLTLSGKVVISGNTTGVAGMTNVVMNSSGSDVLFVDELSAGSDVSFKTNQVTATAAAEVIAIAEGGSQENLFQSEWITYMDAEGSTKSLTYGAEGFYFVEGHYHGDQKYAAWTETTKLPDADTDGVGYYLTDDVKISAYTNANICNISGGKVLHLCVNGKTISRNTTKNVKAFEIKDGSVYLSDCTTQYDEDGLFVSGGKISGFANLGDNGGNGSAMYIYNAASVVEIQGIEFANNQVKQSNLAYGGGAIQIRNGNTTPVKITGCKFTNNTSSGGSGAISIRNASQLIVEKTIFTGNSADTGGVFYMDAGTLVVKDSKIVGNTARNASVINVLGDTTQVTFINTEISGNTNTGDVGYGTINCANSKAKVKLEGKTVVYDNKNKNGEQANLFLQNYAGVVYDVSGLTDGAKVGVSMIAERITSGYLYFSTAMTANPGFCVSDDPAYTVTLDSENRLALAEKSVTPPADSHTHKLCGDAACTEHNEVTFQKWEKTDSLPTSGNWYLAEDVTLSAVTETTGDLVLCLNGKTITQTAQDRVFLIAGDKVLSVTDCGTAGTITGGRNDYGSVVRVNEGATFNLYGGKLTGNGPKTTGSAAAGATVFLRWNSKGGATFNMYGGEITGNGGNKCWGGAVTNGSGSADNTVYVNIYGGKIYNNTASTGGAIRMENASVTTIYGGEIYGNRATSYGGAIYLNKNAQLKLQGGTIEGNTADISGGGVQATANAGAVTLSGNVTVNGNTVKGEKSNLYLAGEKTMSVSGMTGGQVGLTKDAAREDDTVSSDTVTEAQKAYFSSDNGDHTVYLKDGKLALGTEKIVTDHMHTICCDTACADHMEDVPFRKWEKTDSLPLSGNWYLAGDVELSAAYYDDSTKVTGVLNLCLNGHTVTAMEGKRHLMVTKGAVLNLTDCGTTGALTGGSGTWGASININAGAIMNLYGGKISGNKCTAASGGIGAIYVQGAGAIFNMYGGEISDNESVSGTIYSPDVADGSAKAQVNIYGGAICDNQVNSAKNSSGSTVGGYGGAITANKNTLVNIYGGEIKNNTGARYGAIFVTGQGTVLTMEGGTISDNTANNGAAVMLQTRSVFNFKGGSIENNTTTGTGGAIYVSTNTDLNMTGGTVSGNRSGSNGGGIYVYQARANLLGGTITGNEAATNGGAVTGTGTEKSPMVITLGGNVQITDNQVGDKLNNLYLADDQTVKVQALDSTAKIGLSVNVTDRAISEIVDADYSAAFQPDNHKLTVTYKEQKLWIEKIPEVSDHYHCVCNGVKNDICDHSQQMWIKWGDDAEETTSLPTESGYYYLTGNVTLSVTQKSATNQDIYLCLNGHTVTQTTENERHLTVTNGTVYTITDCNDQVGGLTGGVRTFGASVNINVGATFNLFAGKIYGNTAPDSEGGAIYLQENTKNPAIFNLYGGEISGNTAKYGGAIRAAGSSADADKCQVNIYGGTIKENHSTYQGGGIYASNNTVVNLYGGEISGNTSEAEGAGIRMATKSILNLKGTDLTGNVTQVYGGAIFASNTGTKVYLDAGVLSGNKAVAGGAVMLQSGAEMIMNDGTITGNEDTGSGGAGIYVSTGTFFTMNGGKITGNKSAGRGGGIYLLRSEGTFNGGEITNNESAKTGGGLNISGATVVFNELTVKGNSSNEGGGIYVNRTSSGSGDTLKYYPSTVTINEGTLITGNKAPSNCGGLLIANKDVVVTMNGGEISKNESKNGAGVMIWADATFVLKGGKITGHNVKGNGGGMYVSTSGIFKMEGGTITGNTAKNGGGAYFLRSTVTLSGGSITGNVTKQEVKWSNGKETTSGGNGAGFYVAGAKVTMCGTSLTYNKTEKGNGGGFSTSRASYKKNGVTTYDNPVITITGGTIGYNTAYNAGGFLTQTGTVTYLRGGTVTGNTSLKNGAGVYISTKSELQMTGGAIINNNSNKSAGGIYFYRSKGTVTGGQIHGNTAVADSGNILVNGQEADVTIKNMKIYDGKAKTAGGMVFQGNGKLGGSGKLYVENCDFYNNKADGGSSGAIYVGGRCAPVFVNCKFFDNQCSTTGGAMRIEARSYGTFTNCVFENNTAGKDGGGLWLTTCTELTMTDCVFRGNHSDMKGGAIGCYGNIDMTNCVLEDNTSKDGGGAIYNHFNTASAGGFQPGLIMKNCKVNNNQTEGVGGGIWAHKSVKTKLYDTEVTGNTAALEGGAIWVGEDIELNNTTITGNTSGGEGYAVYISDGEYDGHSYITSRNKVSGDVIINENEGGDLWMGPDITIVIGGDGLGEKAHVNVTLDSGVVTNRIFGAYHYEGGNQVYTITYGDRSMTEPEYDASLAVVKEAEQKQTNTDVLLYVGIGVIGLAAIAAVVLVLLKKKKAGEPAKKD